MSLNRGTLGVLAALSAPLGGLLAAVPAQATPLSGAPTIAAVTDLGVAAAGTASTYYINDTANPLTVNVTGADPGAGLTIFVDNGMPIPGTAGSDGTASVAIGALAANSGSMAQHTVTVSEDNSSAAPSLAQLLVDNVPALAGPMDGGTVYSAQPEFNAVQAIPGQPVELSIDGQLLAAPAADANGVIQTMSPSQPLSVGHHTATATTLDTAGSLSDSSSSIGFYVAPPVPTVTSPSDQSSVNRSQPPVTVSGIIAGATVTLYQVNADGSSSVIATTTSPNGGSATLTPTTALADGQQSLFVSQTVSESNTLVESDVNSGQQISVNVLASAPSVSTSFPGALTNQTQPWFNFSGALSNNVGSTSQVELIIDGALSAQTSSGSGSVQPTTALRDGQHTAYVVTVDDQGHVSDTHSNALMFTVDATPPGAPTVLFPAAGSTVTTSRPTIHVHTEPGASLSLSLDDGSGAGAIIADGNGDATFQDPSALRAGPHSLWVGATDAAGNTSTTTDVTFTVAAAVPTPTPKPAGAPPAPTRATLSGHTLSAGHPVKLGFSVSKPGTILLTLTRKVHGKTQIVGTVKIAVHKAGKVSYTLTKRFAGHKLAAGGYQVTVQSVSGHRHSKALSQKLTVR